MSSIPSVPDTDQAMAILTLGYTDYVVPIETAIQIAGIVASAPRYKSNYTINGRRSFHIWSDTEASPVAIVIISPNHYRMAKAAGEPPNS